MDSIVFLLGAGASVEAGMPSAKELTCELRRRLDSDQADVFEFLRSKSNRSEYDYEAFFEDVSLTEACLRKNFIKLIMPEKFIESARRIKEDARGHIYDILLESHRSPKYNPDYLVNIFKFMEHCGRVKVFTLNYDLCVEDGCERKGIDVTTGFHPSKGWMPELFDSNGPGINLYKLHGSLNWTIHPESFTLVEDDLPDQPQSTQLPELVLGPSSKLQPDDPFLTLYYEFHKAIRSSQMCVCIGYSFRDDHINTTLKSATKEGKYIIDVRPYGQRPANSSVGFDFKFFCLFKSTAKAALEGNDLRAKVRDLLNRANALGRCGSG